MDTKGLLRSESRVSLPAGSSCDQSLAHYYYYYITLEQHYMNGIRSVFMGNEVERPEVLD